MSAFVQNWFTVTTASDKAWKVAKDRYWTASARIGGPWRPDPAGDYHARMQASEDASIKHARDWYRHCVLGWYRKLCLPLKPGEETPHEVVKLLAEEQAQGRPTS